MSAERRRHTGAPKKIDERAISEERLPRMQVPESEGSAARAQEPVWEIDQGPESTSDSAFERDETRDRLLSAISETDVAKLLAPAVDRQPHSPAWAEPPKAKFPSVGTGVQPSAKVVHTESPAGPTRTFIVQSSPVGASVPLMPLAATQPRHPAAPEPDSIIESEKPRYKLLRAINESAHLEGHIPASNPYFRHLVQTSPQAASAPLMPPPTELPRPRESATPRMIEAATWAAIPKVVSSPQPVAVLEPVAAATTIQQVTPAQDPAPVSTILVWCSSGVIHLSAKLAQITKRMGRALWQISVRFKSPLVKAKGGLTMVSAAIAVSRPSTGLDDHAHAGQSAPETESMGRATSQLESRLQNWLGPRRRARIAKPPAVAYCWTVDTPDPIEIADISSGGVHLLTDVRWPRGGVLSMTLQRTDRTSEMPESWVVIDFVVTRLCSDGVAGAFIPTTHRLSGYMKGPADNCADDRTLKRFVKHLAA